MIAKGIKKIKKPQSQYIFIDATTGKVYLDVISYEGKNNFFVISKKVAEVLIAGGMSYGS